ncbi:AfsR/SARP family transcriptional regulator [Fodinicola acaciae]|uniref:AfsR/SARP family transcriptional regulator n=1 Tax=Fodinicola acaciae TaxID=2681555 RepID=UPI001FE711A6|nr:BTAD domain-containing protein [Fodinicola acaciae]
MELLVATSALITLLDPHPSPWRQADQPSNESDLLDRLEGIVVTRRRMVLDGMSSPTKPLLVVVVASALADDRRLKAVSVEIQRHQLGVRLIVLATNSTGASCTVAADGLVTTESTGLPQLSGARLGCLPAKHLAELLTRMNGQPSESATPIPAARSAEESLPAKGAEDQADVASAPAPPDRTLTAANKALRMTVFGRFELHDSTGASLSLPGDKAVELLVLLALHRDGLALGEVLAALWPDQRHQSARNALSTLLIRLRRHLNLAAGESESSPAMRDCQAVSADWGFILHDRKRYRLDPSKWQVDAWELQGLMTHLVENRRDVAAAGRALRIHQGHLDAAGAPADWLADADEAVVAQVTRLLGGVAEHLIEANDNGGLAAAIASHLVAMTPDNESLYVLWMRSEAGRSTAVRAIRDLAVARMADIGSYPSRDIIELADRLASTDAVPLRG